MGRRSAAKLKGFACAAAAQRAVDADELHATGGEGGDGDEPLLQKRLRDGAAEAVSAGPLLAHAASSSRRVYGDGSRRSCRL